MINPLLTLFLPSLFSLNVALNSPVSQTSNQSEEIIEKTNDDGIDPTVATATTVGLLTVGGAGSIIIYNNNKNKKENVPSKEIKAEDRDDSNDIY